MSKYYMKKETEDGEIDEASEEQKNDFLNNRPNEHQCKCCYTPMKDPLLLTCNHLINKACLCQKFDITKKLYCPICRKVAWVENGSNVKKKPIGLRNNNKFFDRNKRAQYNNGNFSRKRNRWESEYSSNYHEDESSQQKIPRRNENNFNYNTSTKAKEVIESQSVAVSNSSISDEAIIRNVMPYSIDGLTGIEKEQLIKCYRSAIQKGVLKIPEEFCYKNTNRSRSPELKKKNSPILTRPKIPLLKAPSPKCRNRRSSSPNSHKNPNYYPQNELLRLPSVSHKESISPYRRDSSEYFIMPSKSEFRNTFVEETIPTKKPEKFYKNIDHKFPKYYNSNERSYSKFRNFNAPQKTYNSEWSRNQYRSSPDNAHRTCPNSERIMNSSRSPPDKSFKKSWYKPEKAYNKSRSPERSFNISKNRDRNKRYSPEKFYKQNYNTEKFYKSYDKYHKKPWHSPNKNFYQSKSQSKFNRKSRSPNRKYNKPYHKASDRPYKQSRSPEWSSKKSYRITEQNYRRSRTPDKPVESSFNSSLNDSIRIVNKSNHRDLSDESDKYEVMLESVKLNTQKNNHHENVQEALSPKLEDDIKIIEKQNYNIKIEESLSLSPSTTTHPPQVSTSQISGTSSVVSALSKSTTADPTVHPTDYNISLLHSTYSRMYNASLRMKEFEVNSAEHNAAYQEYSENYEKYQRLYSNYESSINLDNMQRTCSQHNTAHTTSHSSANSELPNPDDDRLDVNSLHDNYADDTGLKDNDDQNCHDSDNDKLVKDSPSSPTQTIQVKKEETIDDEAYKNMTDKVDNDWANSGSTHNDAGDINVSGDNAAYDKSNQPMKTEGDVKDSNKDSQDTKKDLGFLWLSNLSSSTKANDICDIFKKYGNVKKVKIFEYSQPPLPSAFFALVSMSNSGDAENAMNELQNYRLYDMHFSIKKLSWNDSCKRLSRYI